MIKGFIWSLMFSISTTNCYAHTWPNEFFYNDFNQKFLVCKYEKLVDDLSMYSNMEGERKHFMYLLKINLRGGCFYRPLSEISYFRLTPHSSIYPKRPPLVRFNGVTGSNLFLVWPPLEVIEWKK